MRPGHGDHIQQAFANRVACRRNIDDARRVKDRQADLTLEGADDLQPWRDGGGHARHVVRCQSDQRVHAPVIAIEEIDVTGAFEDFRDGDAVLEGQTFFHGLIHRAAKPDQEIVADLPTDFFEHHQPESATVFQRAAKSVRPLVGHRRQELTDQVGIGERLDPVQPAFLAALRRRTVGLYHTDDVVIIHFLGKAAVQCFPDRRRPDGRQPVIGVGFAAAPQMRDLTHDRRAMHRGCAGKTPGDRE